jgi:hypothetical protein
MDQLWIRNNKKVDPKPDPLQINLHQSDHSDPYRDESVENTQHSVRFGRTKNLLDLFFIIVGYGTS